MRLGIIWERKADFPFEQGDPREIDSELFSHEEEDDLLSGLRDAGHEVVRIGDGAKFLNRVSYWRKRCDLVFNLSVGYRGAVDRKVLVPGALELAQIPYIGSAPHALTITRHKYHAEIIVAAGGVKTPPAVLWTGPDCNVDLAQLPYPVIVKPAWESSSIGIVAGRSRVGTP